MKRCIRCFNLYFVLCASLLAACKTTEQSKQGREASTLRVYLEVGSSAQAQQSGVPIFRKAPVMVNIDREPFLTELDVSEAAVVEAPGGFSIRVTFNRHGALILENVSTTNKGRRAAIQSSFKETRWLAAPVLSNRISNGVLVFAPDATREEAERIVRGLNNVAAKVRKQSGP